MLAKQVEVEDKAIRGIEITHMKRKYMNFHIALEDIDFLWTRLELSRFRDMWREGKSIQEMEEKLKRSQEEIAVIIIDQARRGYINPRKHGIFG